MSTCGTYGGAQAHVRKGEEVCEPCRTARSEYRREYRKTHPGDAAYDRRMNAARSRALWRLAEAHPDEFRTYLDEERKA